MHALAKPEVKRLVEDVGLATADYDCSLFIRGEGNRLIKNLAMMKTNSTKRCDGIAWSCCPGGITHGGKLASYAVCARATVRHTQQLSYRAHAALMNQFLIP